MFAVEAVLVRGPALSLRGATDCTETDPSMLSNIASCKRFSNCVASPRLFRK